MDCRWRWGPLAFAQNYPDRPLHLIVPYGPGGITDFAGRTVGQALGKVLGQTVVVDNKPGAGGIVGVDYVAHSAADGYDMAIMDPAIVINPLLQKSMPYDIFTDLVTLSRVSSSPEVLVVSPQLGVKTYADLVAYGKANPGKLNYASAGVGTAPHLAAVLWELGTGIQAEHVPYKGIGGSYPDLMSNKVQLAFSSIPGALPVHERQSGSRAGDDDAEAFAGLSRFADRGRVSDCLATMSMFGSTFMSGPARRRTSSTS